MDDLEARLLNETAAEQWALCREPGPPPPEFVEAVRGTFLFQRRLVLARWRAFIAAVREAARWN